MTERMTHLNKANYTVATVSLLTAQRLIAAHHYAKGSANTATFRHGLFARANPSICLGVACWLPPTKSAAAASWDRDWRRVLSLSRLVIVPEMPTNAASYLLGRSIRLIRQDGRFLCLVTYADEWQGHTGAIYKATNWEYVGLTGEEPIYAGSDGRMTARKAGARTRTGAQMAELGYGVVARSRKHKFRLILTEPRRAAPRGNLTLEIPA